MPRNRKLAIQESKLEPLFKKYESELKSLGWRNSSSAWGKMVSELGLKNNEINRHRCYNYFISMKDREPPDIEDGKEHQIQNMSGSPNERRDPG